MTKVAFALGCCYVILALAVHLRLLDHLDLALRDAVRPNGVWGPMQVRADRLANEGRPSHVAAALALAAAAVSLLRRSLGPLLVAAMVAVPVAAATLVTKWLMAHSDGSSLPVAHGSFPSGHAVSIVVATGIVVLLVRPRTRWGWLLPAVAGVVMSAALVVATVHPATDVIGAGLLGAAALTGACAVERNHRMERQELLR